jgi:alcohol dehydrogenase (cytochrome c)
MQPWKSRDLAALLAAAAALLAGCAQTGGPAGTSNGAAGDVDVTTYGLDKGQQRYSSLGKINRGNVNHLVPAWSLSLDSSANTSTQPLVIDGTMYVATYNATVAIDAVTGRQKWKSMLDLPADVSAMVCCGSQARGLAYRDGVLFRPSLDAHLMAINAADGKVLWRTKVAEYKEGFSITSAPLLVGDTVITGMSGAEFNTRGFIRAYDAKTGKALWTRYTTPAPGEKGSETWNGSDKWKTGGASTWITGSYDADLDLVYWGTGNGSPFNPAQRANGGDSLYICSVLAIRPKTGELVWHYQFSPGDAFDYDAVAEMVLAEIDVGGKPTKVLLNANRNGFFYVLDRSNGKLLAANLYGKKVNWASGIDMATGRPIDSDITRRFKSQAVMTDHDVVFPSWAGVKNWMPIAYDPNRKLAYVNGINFGMKIKNIRDEPKLPAIFLAVDIAGYAEPEDGNRGFMAAIDPMTGKHVWDVPLKIPQWAGVLATGGGLLFTGSLTGEFLAYDSDSGKQVWKFQTGSGISGIPITWQKDGKQYVTVTSGAASIYAGAGGDPALPAVPAGGAVWTFALH